MLHASLSLISPLSARTLPKAYITIHPSVNYTNYRLAIDMATNSSILPQTSRLLLSQNPDLPYHRTTCRSETPTVIDQNPSPSHERPEYLRDGQVIPLSILFRTTAHSSNSVVTNTYRPDAWPGVFFYDLRWDEPCHFFDAIAGILMGKLPLAFQGSGLNINDFAGKANVWIQFDASQHEDEQCGDLVTLQYWPVVRRRMLQLARMQAEERSNEIQWVRLVVRSSWTRHVQNRVRLLR
jgi:hypothetical protein